jgi:two-component system, cell cycle response regulator DivK
MAKSVLIVEDNDHLRNIFASIVQISGHQAIVAASGTEGIERAISLKPDLILLDLDLPDMAGIDVARTLKKNQSSTQIPIIGCSAFSASEGGEKALLAGMIDYLQKPIPSKVLKAKIQEYCG